MKIVIFEPHPDDLLFGPGPILLQWIKEGHDIHIITVTDGRALFRGGGDVYAPDVQNFSEDEVASMRIEEAKQVLNFLGLTEQAQTFLRFQDAEGQKYVAEAIERVKPLLKGIDRLVLPSDNNLHVDHQATHDIAIGAAKELQLKEIEYFVYFVAAYGKFQEDSEQHQIQIPLSEEMRKKLFEWLNIYESQKKAKYNWKMYNRFLKKWDTATYGLFKWEDMGKYHNF